MSAIKKALKEFTFPFELHDYQIKSIEEAVQHDCILLRHGVGLGKSAIALATALYHSIDNDVEQILILCPPVLLDQWYEFIKQIPEIGNVCLYRGTPLERKQMPLESSDVILCSYNIFRSKIDFPRIKKVLLRTKTAIIGDEVSFKSLKSQTYRKLKQVIYRRLRVKEGDKAFHYFIALNATPVSDPMHCYNWFTVMWPGVYISKRIFESVHVKESDHWGNVMEWKELDLLESNMRAITVDAPKGVIKLPEINYNVFPYKLEKKHLRLYNKVKQAKLSELPEDLGEFAVRALFFALQEVVINPGKWEPSIRPAILDYLDSYISQLGGEQCLIYTRQVAVSQMLHEYFGDKEAVAVYGKVSAKQRDIAFERVKSGDAKILIGNLDSLSVGLNLQFITHTIFCELPFRADKLEQAVGRTHRQGQNKPCFINIPLAKGTIQRQIYYKLLKNSEDIGAIYKDKQSLKDFLET